MVGSAIWMIKKDYKCCMTVAWNSTGKTTFLSGPHCLCLRHQPQTLSMSLLSQKTHLSLVAPKAVIQSFQLVGLLPLIVLLCLPLVAFKSKSLSCFIPAFVVIGKLESHGAGRPSAQRSIKRSLGFYMPDASLQLQLSSHFLTGLCLPTGSHVSVFTFLVLSCCYTNVRGMHFDA